MLEPAATVVRLLGGPTKVSRIIGIHRTKVSNWMRPKDHGGTGGIIPQRHHVAILRAAKDAGLPITAEDFLPHTEAA